MKKFLALIAITLFVFAGCTTEEITPVVEEDITTPDVVVEDVDTIPTPASAEYERLKEEEAKETSLIDADNDYLNKLAEEREITLSDCEDLKSEISKADCKEAYGDN